MNQPIAKPVVKNKFWVVENSGKKIATIQAKEEGGFVYVHDEYREFFTSVKNIKQKYNIKFSSIEKIKKENSKGVYGYPITGKSFNEIWDVQRKLPIYTKTNKSKSQYCAGFYLVKLNGSWVESYCPKNITLNRYAFLGPFRTKNEAVSKLQEIYEKS